MVTASACPKPLLIKRRIGSVLFIKHLQVLSDPFFVVFPLYQVTDQTSVTDSLLQKTASSDFDIDPDYGIRGNRKLQFAAVRFDPVKRFLFYFFRNGKGIVISETAG